jgi:hypothetical protein
MSGEIIIGAVVITASNVVSLVLGIFVGRALWRKETRKW